MKVPKKCVIADIGTGSGALAITAALELPNVTVLAVDIDPNCLLVARKNANKYDVAVQFFEGNLLAPLANLPVPMLSNIILCNLPYVPDEFHINVAAMHEPKLAIFGGTDGLDYYRTLFDQINSLDTKPSYILTESLPSQHPALLSIAAQYGYKQQVEDDFIQLFTRL
jgi:release factor glutamine methyltransferase